MTDSEHNDLPIVEGFELRRLGDKVLRLRIDAPQRRNALSLRGLERLGEWFASLRGDVVLLDAAPCGDPRVFSAGADLQELTQALREHEHAPDLPLIAATQAMRGSQALFVACVDGLVIGAAVELVCSCDFVLMSSRSSLRIPAARLGVAYHVDGLVRLRTVLGENLLRQLLLADRPVTAQRLHDLGVATELVDEASLEVSALDFARDLASMSRASQLAHRAFLRRLAESAVADTLRHAHEAERDEHYAALRRRARAQGAP